MPREIVCKLDRLRGGSRTHHVNRAVATYLEVQGPAVNRYGVDCDYFRGKLAILVRDIGYYTPEELREALRRLSCVASDVRGSINEEV